MVENTQVFPVPDLAWTIKSEEEKKKKIIISQDWLKKIPGPDGFTYEFYHL